MTAPPLALDARSLQFVQGPVSMQMATCDAQGRPQVALCLGCGVFAADMANDAQQIGVYVHRVAAANCLAAIAQMGAQARIALVCSQLHINRSLQLKGAVLRVRDAAPADVDLMRAWVRGFAQQVSTVGAVNWPRQELASALTPPRAEDVVVIDFLPQAAFEQTPGATAGQALGMPGTPGAP